MKDIVYLFYASESRQWFIHENGVNTPISAEMAQRLEEDGYASEKRG